MEQEGRPAPVQRVQIYSTPPKVEQEAPSFKMELVPCYPKDKFDVAWALIRAGVEELAQASHGEYSAYDVSYSLLFGVSHLYIGFVDGKYAGFSIIRYEKEGVHVWQAYILPNHRHSNVFTLGAAFIEEEVRKLKAKFLNFSALKEWGPTIESFGFSPTYTIYRKELKY